MPTFYAYVTSPEHAYPGHPENIERFSFLDKLLQDFPGIERIDAQPAHLDEIKRVHTQDMITGIESACKKGSGIIDFAPTYVTSTSFDDALLAAGGCLACSRAVLDGRADNAFAIVRPPGHHAEPERAMGFCLFNNVAISAQEALTRGLERILVVDFDAHHGNGTQAAFWQDERMAYFSTHQENIYPGTGWQQEAPHARGRIANLPLPAYAGDICFKTIADQAITPLVETFRPQFILVSVGFDAHWNDPLTALGLTINGFYDLSKRLVELAHQHCNGKIVFVLEGGYKPKNVADGCRAVLMALTSSGSELGIHSTSPYPEPDIEPRLLSFRNWHGL